MIRTSLILTDELYEKLLKIKGKVKKPVSKIICKVIENLNEDEIIKMVEGVEDGD